MNVKVIKGTITHDNIEYKEGGFITDLDKKTATYLKSLGVAEVLKGKVPENQTKAALKKSEDEEDEEDTDPENDEKGGPNTGLEQ